MLILSFPSDLSLPLCCPVVRQQKNSFEILRVRRTYLHVIILTKRCTILVLFKNILREGRSAAVIKKPVEQVRYDVVSNLS